MKIIIEITTNKHGGGFAEMKSIGNPKNRSETQLEGVIVASVKLGLEEYAKVLGNVEIVDGTGSEAERRIADLRARHGA